VGVEDAGIGGGVFEEEDVELVCVGVDETEGVGGDVWVVEQELF
jgi:hypothetical protein